MLVACLTSLVALNGKNHAGTGNSAAFTVTQPLERAQNDAFGHPNLAYWIQRLIRRIRAARGFHQGGHWVLNMHGGPVAGGYGDVPYSVNLTQ